MKPFLALFLFPLALTWQATGALRRLWAWTCLKVVIRDLAKDTVVLGPIETHGSRQISTGQRLYLYRDLYLETRENGRIVIGNDVVISRGVHIVAFESIHIGDGTMIGEYASIRDANHQFREPCELRDAPHHAHPVVIGKNVWIGRGAVVLTGVRIGDRAVIGSNAVVTKDIAPGTVVAGVPARIISQFTL